MADIKSAQLLLLDLPKNDALKAVQELTTWIESVREHDDFRVDHQLAVLRLLDEAARPLERKLTREYFAGNALTPFQENRIWVALNEFYQHSAQAYLHVQMRYCHGSKGSTAIQSALPLVAARGIAALMGRLKCAAARYVPPEPGIWEGLAALYAHAEAQKYLDEPVALYASASANTSAMNTSVRQEFASALMWHASGISAFNPLQIHLAERLAAHFARHFSVSPQREADSLFGFNLQQPAVPMRLTAENKEANGMRYLGAGSVQPQVEALLGMLQKNTVPETINLGGVFDADTVQEVIRQLSAFWVSAPPVRRDKRHNVIVKMYVIAGYAGLLQLVDPESPPAMDSSEPWTAEDISVSGLRCVLPPARAKGVEVGLLVGTRPERGTHWGAGFVRRLSRDKQNNLHVGIELLGNQVTLAKLRVAGATGVQRALWLNNPGDTSGEVRLLMGPGAFSSGRSLPAELDGKNCLLMPLALLEKSQDYDLARFRRVEQDVADGA